MKSRMKQNEKSKNERKKKRKERTERKIAGEVMKRCTKKVN